MTILRSAAGALAVLAIAAPAASAHGGGVPDAEIFATNNTAVITDPNDPRLRDPLKDFARQVERIVEDGGGDARGSELLDGVFFSADEGTTTFERSRGFDVDRVSEDELHTIADTIRSRFGQQSVLTFDHLPAGDADVDAIELEVPGVSAQALRDGLLANQEARERLFGGSVTQDRELLLVAGLEDAELARSFAKSIGGDVRRAVKRFGRREFVDGPLPVRVEQRTLVIEGGADDETTGLKQRAGRYEVDLGNDGSVDFAVARHRVDRARVDAGEGLDTLALDGSADADKLQVTPAGDRVRVSGDDPVELDGVEILEVSTLAGADELTVADLSATDVFQVTPDLGAGIDRAAVLGSGEDDQISVSSFGVLGPTFVNFVNAERDDSLTVDGRGGDDIVSASTDAMKLTLAGGGGDNVLIGGPGDDRLIGGDGFDDASGGKGQDVALLGGYFDRFTWKPGDGNDRIDGGASRDSLSFSGTTAAEAFSLAADGRSLRFSADNVVLGVDGVEEFNTLAGGGADTFAVGDLRRTDAQLVDISLAPGPGFPGGDGAADRVTVAGTDKADALKLVGKVVVGGTATLTGLSATVNISHTEGALDTLAIDTGAGNDSVDSSGLAPGTIGLQIND